MRELGLGALQAWQALSEAQGRGRGSAEVAILFTDLVGFSSWALEAGDETALELLRRVAEAEDSRDLEPRRNPGQAARGRLDVRLRRRRRRGQRRIWPTRRGSARSRSPATARSSAPGSTWGVPAGSGTTTWGWT